MAINNVILVDRSAPLDPEIGQDPGRSRRDNDALVRFGATGEGELRLWGTTLVLNTATLHAEGGKIRARSAPRRASVMDS